VRAQLAGFPEIKRLEQFDFKLPASMDRQATTFSSNSSARALRARCDHIILTSNKSYGEWGAIIQDNVIASESWTVC
jgi:hypothetical protein